MVALKLAAIKDVPHVEAVPQEPPVGDHQANGDIEVAVKDIKRMVRTIKIGLESKLKVKLEDDDPVLAWIPWSVAENANRYRIGPDSKTAEQRRTGKRWREPAVEYGEKIYFKEATYHHHFDALELKMVEGRYLGHHGRTGALLAITSEGVRRGKGLRRLPE